MGRALVYGLRLILWNLGLFEVPVVKETRPGVRIAVFWRPLVLRVDYSGSAVFDSSLNGEVMNGTILVWTC